jgi:UDP-N-acetylglucosamine acyltransferase
MDVPPYCMMAGSPGVITGLNIVGMRRAKFSSEKIQLIKNIYKIVFIRSRSPGQAFTDLEDKLLVKYNKASEEYKLVSHYIEFLKSCKRGIAPRHK